MQAFRLVKARRAATALDGEGARRFGGRWNPPGVALVYCSSSLSLAVLELLVHVEPLAAPDDLVAVQIELPEDLAQRRLVPADLPTDWRTAGRAGLRALGAEWIRAGNEAVLVVPSAIVPAEANILVNPAHPAAARIRILAQEPFSWDPRLS